MWPLGGIDADASPSYCGLQIGMCSSDKGTVFHPCECVYVSPGPYDMRRICGRFHRWTGDWWHDGNSQGGFWTSHECGPVGHREGRGSLQHHQAQNLLLCLSLMLLLRPGCPRPETEDTHSLKTPFGTLLMIDWCDTVFEFITNYPRPADQFSLTKRSYKSLQSIHSVLVVLMFWVIRIRNNHTCHILYDDLQWSLNFRTYFVLHSTYSGFAMLVMMWKWVSLFWRGINVVKSAHVLWEAWSVPSSKWTDRASEGLFPCVSAKMFLIIISSGRGLTTPVAEVLVIYTRYGRYVHAVLTPVQGQQAL